MRESVRHTRRRIFADLFLHPIQGRDRDIDRYLCPRRGVPAGVTMPMDHAIGDAKPEDEPLGRADQVTVVAQNGRFGEQLFEAFPQGRGTLEIIGRFAQPFDDPLDPVEQVVETFLPAALDDCLGEDVTPGWRGRLASRRRTGRA